MIYIVFIFDTTRCGYVSHIYNISMKAFIEYPHHFWKLPPATSRTTGICILGIIPRIGHHNAGSTVLFSDNFTLWCLLWWIRRKLFFAARAPQHLFFHEYMVETVGTYHIVHHFQGRPILPQEVNWLTKSYDAICYYSEFHAFTSAEVQKFWVKMVVTLCAVEC